jgi:hypothetical protein
MKKLMKHKVMLTLLLIGTLTFLSCTEKETWLNDKYHNDYRLPLPTDIAWPEGSILTYLNGNVILDVLPGAVTQPVKMMVNECHNGQNCDYLLTIISIGPAMTFDEHVIVSLKYDGELANGEIPVDGCSLLIHYWEKQEDYYNGTEGEVLCCYRNADDSTINFCIEQTGVFAVGSKN